MAVALFAQARTRIGTIRARDVAAPVTGLVVLAGAAAGGYPPLSGVAAGVGLVAAWAAAVLIRTALTIHRAQRRFAGCRGAGFLGLAALVGGFTAGGLPLLAAPVRPVVAACGLTATVLFCVVGMLLLPGAATTVAQRLRRAFDALGLAVSLALAVFLIPPGPLPPAARVASLCGSAGIAVVTVIGLRAAQRRRQALLCGGGAAAGILGSALLTGLLVHSAPAWSLPSAAALIVVGLGLTVAGGRRVDVGVRPADGRDPDLSLTGVPLLAVPAAVVALAALYRLLTVGRFDRASIAMGIGVVAVLAMREVLAVIDVRRYARRLAVHEAHFRSLVAGATDLTLVVAEDLVVRWQSPVAARLFGLSDADVVGRAFTDLIHPDDAPRVVDTLSTVLRARVGVGSPPLVAARLRDGHGVWRDTESTVSDQRGVPEVAALVVHVRDVGERRHLERTLHQLTSSDQLTGLANRRELMRAIDARRSAAGNKGALLVIDLHGVGAINDERGREVGDAVLIEVGRRLRAMLGPDDVPARLAGDEFAVVTAESPVLAYALAARVVTVVTKPYQLPGAIVDLHVSVGLAELTGTDDVEDVLRRADLARRRARQLGRDRVEWFDTNLQEQLLRRLDLERDLPTAITRGELDLVYQPVLGLRDRRPVGVEALLRWRHPTAGTIMPAELVQVAESVAMLSEVGGWVLDRACRQLASWSSAENPPLWVSVNVSAAELIAADFPDRVVDALTGHRVAPDRLVVEIAEADVADHAAAVVSRLTELRKLGVRAALDDFGVGEASLAYLRRLPVDVLKLDRALVAMATDRDAGWQPVMEVVVSLGRRLGLEIIAEGLESADQIERAVRAGCSYGQGFALARPAPAEHTEAFIEERHAGSA